MAGGTTGSTVAAGGEVTAVNTALSARSLGGSATLLGAWAVLLLLVALIAPPVVAQRLRQSRQPAPDS